jgi:ectoine hydroxylase-related dioxygenase (phytanoyl-CoA dioxygenase family)
MNAVPSSHAAQLRQRGFCVITNVVPASKLPRIATAYGRAIAEGTAPDLHTSSSGSNTRLSDLVNRGAEFDELYLLAPVLEACSSVIGAPFKLSSLQARTVLPGAPPQRLHVDVRSDQDAWPLVGFIVMVDEFRSGNGATRFVPGSHSVAAGDAIYPNNHRPDDGHAELACGGAGSVIVYHGSTWHGFSANDSAAGRRSIQGAYIPQRGAGAFDWAARMRPETAARLSAAAKQLLAVP